MLGQEAQLEKIDLLTPVQQTAESPMSSNGTAKDPLRYTPSKRMFFRANLLKKEENERCCLKPKIMKKKRHKDKLRLLFKLDKHLLDPLQCHLGKSGKSGKKKDKLVPNAQISGSKIPVGEESGYVGKNNQVWQFKPLEFTLCSIATQPKPPCNAVEEDKEHKPLNDNFLGESSFSPTQKATTVTNKLVLGGLNDSGTPSKFDSDSHREISDPKPHLPGFSPFLNNSKETTFIKGTSPSHDIMGHLSLESVELTRQPIAGAGRGMLDLSYCSTQEKFNMVQDHQCQMHHEHWDASRSPNISDSTDNRVSSPLLFNGFPCLELVTDEREKQQITTELKSGHSLKVLIDRLNKDPFPKIVRENAKAHVRRRAISMDDTLISFLPSRHSEEAGGQPLSKSNQSKDEKAEEILNPDGPCTQSLEMNSSWKSSGMIEDTELSDLVASLNSEEAWLRSDESGHDNSNGDSLSCSDLKSMSEADADGGKVLFCDTSLLATDGPSSSPDQSASTLPVPCDAITGEDASDGALDIATKSPPNAQNSEMIVGEIRASVELDEAIPEMNTDDTPNKQQVKDHNHAATNRWIGDEDVNNRDETSSAKPSAMHIAEQNEKEISFQELQVPSDVEESPDQNNTIDPSKMSMKRSPNANSMVRMGHANTSEADENCPLPPKSLTDQTPTTLPMGKEEGNAGSTAFTSDVRSTNSKGHQGDDTEKTDVANKYASSDSQQSTVNQRDSNEVLTQSQSELSPPAKFSDGKVHGATNTHTCSHELVKTSLWLPDENAERAELNEIPDMKTSPIKEIATPTNITPRSSNVDSNYSDENCITPLNHWVLPAGKKFRRSLSIIRNLEETHSSHPPRGRHYEKSVEEIIRLQGDNSEAKTPVQSLRKRLSEKRVSWMRQITPPRARRSTFTWSPAIRDRGTLYETPPSRKSIYSTPMQQNLINRMSIRSPTLGTSSMRSPADQYRTSVSQYTCRDAILTICKQSEPCCFSDIISEECYEGGFKIGEGVFGEVFSIRRDEENTVLKIIPVEGQQLVNGEKQKTYQEVLSELVIAKELNELRYQDSNDLNMTGGYAEIIGTSLVQDSYPEPLLCFWEEFDQTKGSDNENPKMFDNEQLFIVLEQSNGGKDLESYTFSSAKQSLSVFKQLAFSLAVGEKSVEFEHRDLHWGNVLVSKTSKKNIIFTLNGTKHSVASNGVKCTIIDYTLSRIKYNNQVPIYNDIGKDPEMFIATGDYQFDIYRYMKSDVEDDWSRFAPKTNVWWLHYLLDKMLTKVKYQRKTAKVHKDSLKVLGEIYEWAKDCDSAFDIALRLEEI